MTELGLVGLLLDAQDVIAPVGHLGAFDHPAKEPHRGKEPRSGYRIASRLLVASSGVSWGKPFLDSSTDNR